MLFLVQLDTASPWRLALEVVKAYPRPKNYPQFVAITMGCSPRQQGRGVVLSASKSVHDRPTGKTSVGRRHRAGVIRCHESRDVPHIEERRRPFQQG